MRKFGNSKTESGATMIEYALLVSLIAVIAIGGVRILGANVSRQFSNLASTIA